MLSKDEILNKARPRVQEVQVDEWGGAVSMRSLSVAERIVINNRLRDLVKDVPRDANGKLEAGHIKPEISRAIDVDLLATVLVSAESSPLFTAEELNAMDFDQQMVLRRLVDVAYAANGFSSADDADPIESEAKKSDASLSST